MSRILRALIRLPFPVQGSMSQGLFSPFYFEKGGKGSGNFGHAGRPGERGGSGPGSGYEKNKEPLTPKQMAHVDNIIKQVKIVLERSSNKLAALGLAEPKDGKDFDDRAIISITVRSLISKALDANQDFANGHFVDIRPEVRPFKEWNRASDSPEAIEMKIAARELVGEGSVFDSQKRVDLFDGKESLGERENGQAYKDLIKLSNAVSSGILKEAGITELKVYRGARIRGVEGPIREGDRFPIQTDSLTSWSTSYETANDFSGSHIVSAKIPAERVVGLGVFGFGTLAENEVIPFGGQISIEVVKVKK